MDLRVLLVGGLALLAACAQVQPITGGEKDTIPPVLISAEPPSGTILFTGSTIRLVFDERVQLDRVRERALVSPPLEKPPKISLSGPRTVEIALDHPLSPNTTYTFNLDDCVKDLTEGNASQRLNYVCSTGATLDSLRIGGAVLNAYTGLPESGMLVMLYAEQDTGGFRTGRPAYMARTDALGLFWIGNLPHSRFQLFALHDKNTNYRYDLPNEEVAIHPDTVQPSADDSIPPIILRSFLSESPTQFIRSHRVTGDGALQVVLSRPVDTLSVRDIARVGGQLRWHMESNTGLDSLLLWPSDTTALREGIYVLNDGLRDLDTVRYVSVQRMPFHTGLSTMAREPGSTELMIRAARPVASIDPDRFMLISDSVEQHVQVEATADPRKVLVRFREPIQGPALLHILPKGVRDIYGGGNDSLKFELHGAGPKASGSLSIALTAPSNNGTFILQLLDVQQQVVREARVASSSPKVAWQDLEPGLRSIRLIADDNGNGHWDTGSWVQRRQPERTWYYAEPVNIRAAWDVEVEWRPE